MAIITWPELARISPWRPCRQSLGALTFSLTFKLSASFGDQSGNVAGSKVARSHELTRSCLQNKHLNLHSRSQKIFLTKNIWIPILKHCFLFRSIDMRAHVYIQTIKNGMILHKCERRSFLWYVPHINQMVTPPQAQIIWFLEGWGGTTCHLYVKLSVVWSVEIWFKYR